MCGCNICTEVNNFDEVPYRKINPVISKTRGNTELKIKTLNIKHKKLFEQLQQTPSVIIRYQFVCTVGERAQYTATSEGT